VMMINVVYSCKQQKITTALGYECDPLHLVPGLRMSGAVLLLLQYTFMVCKWTPLPYVHQPSILVCKWNCILLLDYKLHYWNVANKSSL